MRLEVCAQEFLSNRPQYLRMDEIGVVEADLALGRVHIHIVVLEGHSDEQKDYAESIRIEQPAICLADGVRDELIADASPVEEYVLEFVARSRYYGLAKQGVYLQPSLAGLRLDEIIGRIAR